MRLKVLIASLIIGGTTILSGAWNGSAWAGGLVTNLKLTPDLRRLIIMYDGHIGAPEVRTLNNPSRIVVDLPDGRLGPIERIKHFSNKQLRELRTGQHERGARVVLDFGNYTTPKYKLRTIGNYVIVFLGEVGPPIFPVQAQARKSNGIGRLQSRTSAVAHVKPKHIRKKPRARKPLSQVSQTQDDRFPRTSSPLFIKSAKVVNGALLINVGRKGQTNKEYRINLDVDWKRLGFKSADIRSVRKQVSGKGKRTAAKREARVRKPKTGTWKDPRKGLGPYLKAVRLKTAPKGPTRASAKGKPTGPPAINCVTQPCGFTPKVSQ